MAQCSRTHQFEERSGTNKSVKKSRNEALIALLPVAPPRAGLHATSASASLIGERRAHPHLATRVRPWNLPRLKTAASY